MIDVNTSYGDRKVSVQLANGISLWYTPDSGDLKSYIAGTVLPSVFADGTLNVLYMYINYANKALLEGNTLMSIVSNNSVIVIDNMMLLIRGHEDMIKRISKRCPVILIGRIVPQINLSMSDIENRIRHFITESEIEMYSYMNKFKGVE